MASFEVLASRKSGATPRLAEIIEIVEQAENCRVRLCSGIADRLGRWSALHSARRRFHTYCHPQFRRYRGDHRCWRVRSVAVPTRRSRHPRGNRKRCASRHYHEGWALPRAAQRHRHYRSRTNRHPHAQIPGDRWCGAINDAAAENDVLQASCHRRATFRASAWLKLICAPLANSATCLCVSILLTALLAEQRNLRRGIRGRASWSARGHCLKSMACRFPRMRFPVGDHNGYWSETVVRRRTRPSFSAPQRWPTSFAPKRRKP